MKRIPLTQGKFAIVDDEDYEWLVRWKWYVSKKSGLLYAVRNGYCEITKKRYQIHMHRLILGLVTGDGLFTDHIDHNGLNNRRDNLRVCTPQQNQYNRLPQKKGASEYKGVTWNRGRWHAEIKFYQKTINLGRFDTEWDAAVAYNNKAIELYGEFAYLNRRSHENTSATSSF